MTSTRGAPQSAELAIGDLLADRFRITAVLGVGGMSTVYRATDEALGRTVALKVFRSDLADADDVRRQRDEVQLLASLNAPGLVTLFDAVAEGTEGHHGRAFLVLEFVDGVDLRTRLHDGPLDPVVVARIGADVAGALAYIHARNVVHRDVKPGNILLPRADSALDGAQRAVPHAKLADFGIARLLDDARLTSTGTIVGTASYLSPEQAGGVTVSPASDVYSLGLVLLECLTGERAFPGSALESMSARLSRDPEIPARLGLPWATALRAMTARDPDGRPGAGAVADALAALAPQTDSPTDAPTDSPEQTAGRGELATESLDATRVLETPTALQSTLLLPAPAAAPLTEAAPRASRSVRGRRLGAILGALVVAAVIVAIAGMLAQPSGSSPASSAPPSPAATSAVAVPPAVSYPAVSGTLGRDLAELQRSVAP